MTLALLAAVAAVAALPSSAANCTVTVKLITGKVETFQLPAGAPLSDLHLATPVASVTESCPQQAPPPSTTTSTSSSSSTTSTTSTTPSSSGAHHSHKPSSGGSGSKKPPSNKPSTPGKPKPKAKPPTKPSTKPGSKPSSSKKPPSKPKAKKPAPTGAGGVPTASNPTFSFALPGPAPIGVPNFFIDSFRIPPFLLPIYQAAGIEYDVPWQILAGINEIETDYGRNLSVSTAGAVGWMQFMPATWKTYGVDANGDGVADPYNPVDAIFSAARYLHAAGASKSVPGAIFAYNHATWYVQSVLLRAQLIGGLPGKLLSAITSLVQGHFPVAAPAKYADNSVEKLAKQKVKSANAAVPIASDPKSKQVAIYAAKDAPVIAVNDGKIADIGENKQFGRYIVLQDATGNLYTYAHLGEIPKLYPVPKPVKVTAAEISKELAVPAAPKPKLAATAGTQRAPAPPSAAQATKTASKTVAPAAAKTRSQSSKSGSTTKSGSTAKSGSAAPISLPVTPAPAAQPASIPAPLVKERLFAYPTRPASYAAGGALQVKAQAPQLTNFQNYFSDVLHLGKNQYTLQPLKKGAIVVAGTILGRIAAGTPQVASHVDFLVRPAGKNSPYIDPKPILDGWKLLEATAVYRAAGVNPFFGPGAKNPTIGQLLLMSKEQLEGRVLADPHVDIYACGRRDIQAGLIDHRILADIEFLSASALYPTISGLECGHSTTGSTGVDAAGATGSSMDISKVNNVSIAGHQGAGSVTDLTIRRLLTLQGAMKPDEIVSTMSYKGQPNTLALPDHANRIQVSYTPLFGANAKLSDQLKSILQPAQWTKLIDHLGQIPEPVVPIAPSKYALKVARGGLQP